MVMIMVTDKCTLNTAKKLMKLNRKSKEEQHSNIYFKNAQGLLHRSSNQCHFFLNWFIYINNPNEPTH